jgi:hypothetical protein
MTMLLIRSPQAFMFGIYLFRLPIGTNRRNLNVQGLENTQSASVDTYYPIITKHFLEKNLILLVRTALVSDLCSFQQDLKNVECIGLSGEKILMFQNGELHASNTLIIKV